jgi:2-polyprenyl-3-methyl-5-hydroxy-6-metoxy-1,4-benzoquinol methylase
MTILGESIRHTLKKFGKPEKLVKFHLKDQKTCTNAQRITLTRLRTMKEKIGKTRAPFVLDAGCGWGVVYKEIVYSRSREL